ncbi:MAG: ABC transporter ATP-binding protein [Gammaproteobacteria bacterium]|nr:ABC transporter ATP-binding protein [Gammaproteobacteria bacterium]
MLEVRELHKHYGQVVAVDGVSFSIAEGTCFGLLGPNGAGKTTIIEIMEGIASPNTGEVLYRGGSLDKRFREDVGIQFQTTALQDFLTVGETLSLFHRLYEQSKDLNEIIEICTLKELLYRDNRKLSGGQRQRLLLAIALLNDPRVLFLDEPTTGLDPQSRRNFWQLIERIKQEKKTIVLTTHYMEEAYRLCDEIIIIDHGKIIAQGSPSELLAEHFDDTILQLPIDDFTAPVEQLSFPVLQREGCIEISTKDVDKVIKQLVHHGVSLSNLQIRPRTLDDLFLQLTGKELRA